MALAVLGSNIGLAGVTPTISTAPTASAITYGQALSSSTLSGGVVTTANPVVSTLAGSTSGYLNGASTAAQFNTLQGVAVDSSGNVYVADRANHRIRKVTPAGVVSTLAGSGTAGFADGIGTAASFSLPSGIAVDSSGNVYVADNNNNRIRKVTPAGVVSTLAGSGTAGSLDGAGATAQFNYPNSVAVDSSGNVYVADRTSNKIRKVTATGVVSTFAAINKPQGVALDSSENVYVVENSCKLWKVTPAGVVSQLAGNSSGSADGTGTAAQFKDPYGVAVDSLGNIYVGDTGNHRIRKVTSTGVVTTLAGSGAGFADGTGTAAQFNSPNGLAVDFSGNVYVADSSNHRLRKLTFSISGTWAFAASTTVPNAGTSTQSVVFTPSDSANYNTATTSVSVTVVLNPSGDEDGDGLTNAEELNLGTSPTVSQIPDTLITKQSGAIGFVATWGAVIGAAGYEVQVSTEPTFTSGLIGGDRPVSLATTTSLAVTGLSSQIRYYRIRSVIPTNEGPVKTGWSPAVSAPNMTSFGKYVSLNATGNADNFQPASSSSPDNNSYTITFWMRPDKLGGTSGTENVQVIRQAINSGAGTANVDLDLLPDGSLCFGQKDAAGSSKFVQTQAKTVLASNWHHVALVRDSTNSTLRIYLNGQDVATNLGAFGLTSWTINNSLGFGATQDALNADNNLNRFKCAMDDVRVYRAVRTPAQIIQDLSAPLAPTEASANSALVFYAPMEGSSLINTDTSTLSKGSFNAAGSGTITSQSVTPTPILSWTPSPINLNAPAVLSTNELTASAQAPTGGPVAGLWSYSPDAGTSLAVGTNAVVGTFVPTDLNSYSIGAITNQIVVAPAAKLNPTITVNVGSYTYNGSLQGPGVSEVNKSGSTGSVTLQYGGSSMAGVQYGPATVPPTGAGNYTLVATVAADANYNQAIASANFTISKAIATVNVSGTDQIYDGTAKQVTVSTSPNNLPVTIMYSGSSAAPTLVGDYSVMVTVTSPNYSGAASGRVLKIAKATPLLSGITATSISAGQPLSTSTISGTAENAAGEVVTGYWSFQNSSSTPSAGTNDQGVIFTPNDTANYNTATGSVSVTVALDPTGDQDGDGLPNAQELSLGTNPYQKDSDNDGVNDSKEVADGTNPTDASSYKSLSNGLLAYYQFSGNANDSSGNGNNGIPVSPVLSADRLGAANAAYTFNGTSDRIDLANSAALNMNNGVPFSMSAWIKTDFSDGQRVILAKAAGAWGNTPALFVDSEGKLRFDNFYINEVHSSATVRTGTWMHVAVTYDGSTYRLYVNGVADAEKAFTGSNESGNSWTFSIGGSLNTTYPSGMFKGSIDEVQFWGRTLSPAEVAGVVQASSAPANRAPVVGSANLDSISEGVASASNSGTAVTVLTATSSDADSAALKGVAITGVDATHGFWEYSLNGGNVWNSLSGVSLASARLLKSDVLHRVRFVPDANFSGNAEIRYRAWDQTSGEDGALADLTVAGGGAWVLVAYGANASLGGFLTGPSGSFSSSVRNGSAVLPGALEILKNSSELAMTWTASGGSLPSGGTGSYTHGIAFALPNAAGMSFDGSATSPLIYNNGANPLNSSFAVGSSSPDQSLVNVRTLVGSPGMPSQMYLRNKTFGAGYGGVYGLVMNNGSNAQLDYGQVPDGQTFKAVYLDHGTGAAQGQGLVMGGAGGAQNSYVPSTMAMWARLDSLQLLALNGNSPVSGSGNYLLNGIGTTYVDVIDFDSSGAFSANTATGTIVVNPVPVTITAPESISGMVGTAFQQTVTASGSGPIFYSAINLPAGLTIHPTSGVIIGSPTVAGSGTASIVASNTGGSVSYNVSWTIAKGIPTISALPGSMSATGGTISRSGDFIIHTFRNVGSYTFQSMGSGTVEILVVAGGGGGGGSYVGGGGGGGGVLTSSNYSVAAGQSIAVQVGSGGAGSAYGTRGQSGGSSSFGNSVASGGGGGGTYGPNSGLSGGSGGGAGWQGVPGTGVSSQGNNGGTFGGSPNNHGGGGGGASGTPDSSGVGGPGIPSSISGSISYYGGGGSAGTDDAVRLAGGIGGGGQGGAGASNGTDGADNTGGGGGGGGGLSQAPVGGRGGSGIVIVRYKSQILTYGQSIAAATFSGATASVSGSFAFTSPSTTPAVGSSSQSVTFTPTDTYNYETVTTSVRVFVVQATPTILTLPTSSTIVYGQTLSSSGLSGGEASVQGTFTWANPMTAPAVGTSSQSVTFSPTDSANYETVTTLVSVTATDPDIPLANPDAFTAKLAAGMTTKVTTASLISNDKYSGIPAETRGVTFQGAATTSTKGATIEVKAGWLIYRPSSSAQNGTSDTFTYTVSNGIKTATGTVTVSLVTPEYVAEVAIDRVSGDKVYFSVMPGMTFEVQGASQPGTSATWTVLPNGANPYWTSGADGRLIVTDPAAVGSAYRFYKFRWIP